VSSHRAAPCLACSCSQLAILVQGVGVELPVPVPYSLPLLIAMILLTVFPLFCRHSAVGSCCARCLPLGRGACRLQLARVEMRHVMPLYLALSLQAGAMRHMHGALGMWGVIWCTSRSWRAAAGRSRACPPGDSCSQHSSIDAVLSNKIRPVVSSDGGAVASYMQLVMPVHQPVKYPELGSTVVRRMRLLPPVSPDSRLAEDPGHVAHECHAAHGSDDDL
jgi:hypothetical protein